MTRIKNLFLSSHPDDSDRIDEIKLPQTGRFSKSKLKIVGRHKIPGRGQGRPQFLESQIEDWLRGSDLAVVLITANTAGCSHVAEDIRICSEYPRGVVGIRLDGSLEPLENGCCVEQALWHGGFEVVDNGPDETPRALRRAHRLTKMMKKIGG